MRLATFVVTLLLSCICLASGKLTFEPYQNLNHDERGVKFGLSVYEKIVPMVWLNSYAGMGLEQEAQGPWSNDWFVFKNGLVFQPLYPLTLEGGVEFKKGGDCIGSCQAIDGIDTIGYVKMGVQLW